MFGHFFIQKKKKKKRKKEIRERKKITDRLIKGRIIRDIRTFLSKKMMIIILNGKE